MRLDEPRRLVGRIFAINHLAEQESTQLSRVPEDGWVGQRWTKLWHLLVARNRCAIASCTIGQSDGMDDDKDVQELGLDGVGDEWLITIYKDNTHNVVSDMAFSLDLLWVQSVEGEHGRHMVHDLKAIAPGVKVRVFACLAN